MKGSGKKQIWPNQLHSKPACLHFSYPVSLVLVSFHLYLTSLVSRILSQEGPSWIPANHLFLDVTSYPPKDFSYNPQFLLPSVPRYEPFGSYLSNILADLLPVSGFSPGVVY